VVAFGVFVSVLPLFYILLRSAQIGFSELVGNLLRVRTLELILNSLSLTVVVCITAMTIGTAQAWLSFRSDLAFRRLFQIVAILPLAMPSYVLAYAWLSVSSGITGFFGSWLVLSISTTPYVFLAVSAAFNRHSGAGEEVARTLGRSQVGVARTITWPAIRSSVFGSGLLVALYTLSDFGAVSLMRFDTFTRAIYNAYRASFDRNSAAALALVLVALTIVLIRIESRSSSVTTAKSAGQYRAMQTKLGKWQGGAQALLILWFVIGVFVPIISIFYWTVIGQSKSNFGEISRAFVNTISYGVAGGIVVAFVGLAVAVFVVRYQSIYALRVEKTILITHALPGVVVALSFVFLVNQSVPSLYQTSALVLLAYLALFLPNAIAVLKVPISQVPTGIEEVSRTLGSSQLQTLRRAVIPAAAPGILSATAFVALTVIKELPATLILRPTGIETLATRLWSATSVGAFSAAAPYALLLLLVAGIPALFVNREIRSNQYRSNLVIEEAITTIESAVR
jgi:iron(III) transport system permease protein